MKNSHKKIVLLLSGALLLAGTQQGYAQGKSNNAPGRNPPRGNSGNAPGHTKNVPIDGGASMLLAAGALYGINKLARKRRITGGVPG